MSNGAFSGWQHGGGSDEADPDQVSRGSRDKDHAEKSHGTH
jgi:hypothetical protein